MGYQSFPNAPGDSDSAGKLQRLMLPPLKGKSLLDVGCNQGYFCGVALDAGAARVVGIDANASFIDFAAKRFPQAEFHAQGWDRLPDEQFDIVLLLSALHYADDQETLIHRLMDHVKPDGMLVLEIGIAEGSNPAWVEIERAIDVRFFPTLPMLEKLLDRYTFRLIGESVMQAGDPIKRYALHVRKRRPVVIACLGDSSIGKTDLARLLKRKCASSIKVVHLDNFIGGFVTSRLAIGKVPSGSLMPNSLQNLDDLSHAYYAACHGDMLDDLAANVAAQIKNSELSFIEGGVPQGFRASFCNSLSRQHNLDVWMLSPIAIRALELSDGSLRFGDEKWATVVSSSEIENPNLVGHVDEVQITARGLTVIGWGFNKSTGNGIEGLRIQLSGNTITCMDLSRKRRPDVQTAMGSESDLLGFVAEFCTPIDNPDKVTMAIANRDFHIRLSSEGQYSPALPITTPK